MNHELLTIVELPSFLSEVGSTISEDERDDLITFLAVHPDWGDEIPRTGGLRKLRWQSQGKGKRGGLRIIYFYYNQSAPVFLLTVYKKGAKENLSADEERILTKMANQLKANLRQYSGGERWQTKH